MNATENLAGSIELDVGIGEDGPYPAVVTLDPVSPCADHGPLCEPGRIPRWNGWVAEPRFDRATVDRLRATFDRWRAAGGTDSSWLEWSGPDGLGGDTLTVHDPVAEADYGSHTYCTSEASDADGRYAIGAYGWCWYEWDEGTVRE